MSDSDPVLDPEFSPHPAPVKEAADPVGRAFAWLRGHEAGVLAAAVAFQLLILLSMVAASALPRWGAPTVLLKVVPVDPRDLMRGDYVTLGYEIARPSGVRYQPGETVYVELVSDPDGRHYHGGLDTRNVPPGGLFIRGKADGFGRLVFGIESYFVQEGKGHDYERAIFQGKLSAEVSIAPDGQASLRRLVFD